MGGPAGITRRRLLGAAAAMALGRAGAACAAEPATVPRRALGRTGAQVSCLGLGMGGAFLRRVTTEADAARLLNRALDLGVAFWDTGASYGPGRRGERLLAPVLRERRGEVFVATKSGARDYDGTMRSAEASLAALGVERIDLLQIHNLAGEEDLRRIGEAKGALAALAELKKAGKIRFAGVTGHGRAALLAAAVTRYDLDTVMMPLNALRRGGFEAEALPAARRRNVGVIGMQVMGQGALLGRGRASAVELVGYALSLPVAVALVGMSALAELEANAATSRGGLPDAAARDALARRLTAER